MQRKKLLLAVLSIALIVGLVSAALIAYFGLLQTTANVKQAVLVDGQDYDGMPITEMVDVAGGEAFCSPHYLESQTSVPVTLQFDTTYSPALTDDEIKVTYLKPLGYEFIGTSYEIVDQYYPVGITVVDGECEVTWTFDMIAGKTLEGNGHWGYGLAISLDGSEATFQIHNNDGTDANYPWGTHLYSPYYDVSWHSSDENVPVEDLSWVECTGDRYISGNPNGIFTVTISKCMLGEEFHWAVWFGVGGFYNPNNGYSSYPQGFMWQGAVDSYYEKAELAEVLTLPITLQPKESLDFYICYKFDLLIKAGTYNIYTTIKPPP